MNLTDTVLTPLVRTSGARPLITHYDDAAGSRVELSAETLANWAAKTANWLVEECDVEPADPVCVRLPAHWQTAGVLLGALWCGSHVVPDVDDARVAFVAPDDPARGTELTAAVALDAMGMGLGGDQPDGALDFLTEVRAAGDEFLGLAPVDPQGPCLAGRTVADIAAAAPARATKRGIGSGDRVLSTLDWSVPDGALDGLLAPLAVGASLVLLSNADPDKLDDRRTAERTTVDLLG